MQPAAQFVEDRLQAIFNCALDGIITTDESGCFVDVNPAACRMFGRPLDQVSGRHFREIVVSPETVAEIRRALDERGTLSGEFSVWRPDGSVRDLQFEAVSRFLPGMSLSILRDMTDRKSAQDLALQLAALVGASHDALYWLHPEGTIQSWNHGAQVIYGYLPEQIIGQQATSLAGPDRQDEVLGIVARVRKGQCVKQLETVRQRSDAKTIQVSVTASSIYGPGGVIVGIALIERDITRHKALEAQLRQAQKMEAIGQLAGGVAHDFNNLLTIINGNCEVLVESADLSAGAREAVREIAGAGARAASLTRQLLAFGRREIASPVTLDLNEVIVDLERMLRRLVREDIVLRRALTPELDAVRADRGQIEQVITNLVTNAGDAMPDGGDIIIETRNLDVDELFALAKPELGMGPHVMLAVSDTGCGISPETLTRIFDPFFTTKEKGKGTGMGLATVDGIVRQAGGHVSVYSEVGCGTTFKVYFPSEARKARSPAASVTRASAPNGSETILVVEDDAGVRKITCANLTQRGYSVLQAGNGAQAIEVALAYRGKIDLLLTDAVMPGMGGRQLADHLIASDPQLKVVFMSGYTDDVVLRNGVMQSDAGFLQKPFASNALLWKVRDALDGAGPN
jgi:PAS domain S-box-containing protein